MDHADPRPDKLQETISRELQSLENAYRTRNPLFTGVLLSLPGISVLVPMAVRSGASLLPAVWICIGVIWVACCGLAGWWQRRLLAARLEPVRRRIVESGIIERLAMGPETLPDIHRYTARIWHSFLGPPPVSLAHWLKLVSANLNWYLGEPRLWFKPVWVANITLFIPYLAAIAIISSRQRLGVFFSGPASPGAIEPGWFLASALVLVSIGLVLTSAFDYAHQGIVARALRLELEERIAS